MSGLVGPGPSPPQRQRRAGWQKRTLEPRSYGRPAWCCNLLTAGSWGRILLRQALGPTPHPFQPACSRLAAISPWTEFQMQRRVFGQRSVNFGNGCHQTSCVPLPCLVWSCPSGYGSRMADCSRGPYPAWPLPNRQCLPRVDGRWTSGPRPSGSREETLWVWMWQPGSPLGGLGYWA